MRCDARAHHKETVVVQCHSECALRPFFSSCALTLTWQLIFDFCFLYVWLQRDDMEVLDEPLYANFLRATGVDRPYRQELLSKMVRFGTMLNLQFEFPGTTACFN